MSRSERIVVPLTVEIKEKYRIHNVPHDKVEPERTGLEYVVRSSVESKTAEIYEYMKKNDITEYDYNDWK
ncbi:hypothetical protein AAXB25_15195 [Paenibacillus lautus]|uniref:hypothetical protein n=1 Tax=Paenibacillus lautus TaxID=1401 RepID=UPI003D2C5347